MTDIHPGTLIIGGSGGIGSELARRLTAAGRPVHLAARGAQRLEALAAELGCGFTEVEATDADSVDAAVDAAAAAMGGLGGVVNAVGSIVLKPAHTTKPEEWRETIALNLDSAFFAVRASGRVMGRTGGSIVLLSSAAGRVGLSNHDAIGAAKAGVIGLTLSSAATYAPRGLRVNCVAPGLVETPLSERLLANEASRKASESMHPLARIGRPEDVASAIQWLLDPGQSWVTGQVIGVDGGLGSVRPRG